MINFVNVKYHYRQEEFSFDVEIPAGSIVAILGESGAGKSTLLNLAAGFIRPRSGDILMGGKSVLDVEPHLRPMAILFQENNLFAHLSVADNIGLGLHPGLKLSSIDREQVQNIAKQVGVDKLLSRFPDQISGGQKQRVALARCFVQNKPLLLLDEPFSALDPVLREEMLTIVKDLSATKNVTVLMVTHHISDAINVGSHYLFVNNGVISSIDTISKLTDSHQNDSLKKFLQAGLPS
ncbi:ABC transporter for thiamin ATP-binding protein [Psychromonas ingrahamii 37]|uniref:ABC transporter for thiamin ATP-binding protein n=1 Tax=Psychromonas ingrahamii (strain DSM 17664 / CCUG 51855 / 37) TaxID=357804 RepID=A1SRY3_PSYIN|nr:thiamine ABC transporter ATP-binding protein [Psychromonas ingrahamii]ABM02248.1 ABC transporter for thiamin ATP-binding protein [Psychromonas ingrahamii 37]